MTPKDKRYSYDGVHFTMGPISINQFAEFSKHGLGAIRLFQCIKTLQGLTKEKWVKVKSNENIEGWIPGHLFKKPGKTKRGLKGLRGAKPLGQIDKLVAITGAKG